MATLESVLATTPDLFSSMTPNLFSVAFLAVLFYASFVDIRERIISNRVVVAGIALWCVSLLAQVVGVIEGSLFVHEPSSAVGLVFNGATTSSAMNASPGSPCELADACSSNLIVSCCSMAAIIAPSYLQTLCSGGFFISRVWKPPGTMAQDSTQSRLFPWAIAENAPNRVVFFSPYGPFMEKSAFVCR